MNLVVDANIIIACMIKEGKTAEIASNPALSLFSPEFLINEIEKYWEEISLRTHRESKYLQETLSSIYSLITFVKKEEITDYILEAETISPDLNDSIYFALALKLSCPIWSNDKLLKTQDKIKVYSTEDLIKTFKS